MTATTIQHRGLSARSRSVLSRLTLLTAALALMLLPLAPPASAASAMRIVVHTGGLKAGLVEIDVWYTHLPGESENDPTFWDHETAEFKLPNFCGLRVFNVGKLMWLDSHFNEIHPDIYTVELDSPDKPDHYYYYLAGVVFTGPIESVDLSHASVGPPSTPVCGQNPQPSWSFPTPLSYGGNGPPAGAEKLVLELDQPTFASFEFLDHAGAPIKVENPVNPVNPGDPPKVDPCKIPEFCERDISLWQKCQKALDNCTAPPEPINDIAHRRPAGSPGWTIREFLLQDRIHSQDAARRTHTRSAHTLPKDETRASLSTGGRHVG